jgi:L-ascorbate metabolism protein UlaG (beta-lactamase superfamily)
MIDTGDVRIATDPWFAGPAYSQQSYVFPKPVNIDAVGTADVIAISHGHEDHFHAKTSRRRRKKPGGDGNPLKKQTGSDV